MTPHPVALAQRPRPSRRQLTRDSNDEDSDSDDEFVATGPMKSRPKAPKGLANPLEKFREVVREVIKNIVESRGDGLAAKAIRERNRHRFNTNFQDIADAVEQSYVSSILNSLPLMLKETGWLRQVRQAVQARRHGPLGTMDIVSIVMYELKLVVSRVCWHSHIVPLKTELETVRQAHEELKHKFNTIRAEYFSEVAFLRDQLRRREDPEALLEENGNDNVYFFEPSTSLGEEELRFCRKVVTEKLKMILENRPVQTNGEILTLAQLEAMQDRLDSEEVRELKEALARQFKVVERLQEDLKYMHVAGVNECERIGFEHRTRADFIICTLEAKIDDLREKLVDATSKSEDEAREREDLQRACEHEAAERIALKRQLDEMKLRLGSASLTISHKAALEALEEAEKRQAELDEELLQLRADNLDLKQKVDKYAKQYRSGRFQPPNGTFEVTTAMTPTPTQTEQDHREEVVVERRGPAEDAPRRSVATIGTQTREVMMDEPVVMAWRQSWPDDSELAMGPTQSGGSVAVTRLYDTLNSREPALLRRGSSQCSRHGSRQGQATYAQQQTRPTLEDFVSSANQQTLPTPEVSLLNQQSPTPEVSLPKQQSPTPEVSLPKQQSPTPEVSLPNQQSPTPEVSKVSLPIEQTSWAAEASLPNEHQHLTAEVSLCDQGTQTTAEVVACSGCSASLAVGSNYCNQCGAAQALPSCLDVLIDVPRAVGEFWQAAVAHRTAHEAKVERPRLASVDEVSNDAPPFAVQYSPEPRPDIYNPVVALNSFLLTGATPPMSPAAIALEDRARSAQKLDKNLLVNVGKEAVCQDHSTRGDSNSWTSTPSTPEVPMGLTSFDDGESLTTNIVAEKCKILAPRQVPQVQQRPKSFDDVRTLRASLVPEECEAPVPEKGIRQQASMQKHLPTAIDIPVTDSEMSAHSDEEIEFIREHGAPSSPQRSSLAKKARVEVVSPPAKAASETKYTKLRRERMQYPTQSPFKRSPSKEADLSMLLSASVQPIASAAVVTSDGPAQKILSKGNQGKLKRATLAQGMQMLRASQNGSPTSGSIDVLELPAIISVAAGNQHPSSPVRFSGPGHHGHGHAREENKEALKLLLIVPTKTSTPRTPIAFSRETSLRASVDGNSPIPDSAHADQNGRGHGNAGESLNARKVSGRPVAWLPHD